MEENKDKKQIDTVEAHTLRDLLNKVNSHNADNPSKAILKKDIVNILKEEGTYILLYYKG